jgi:hypothetical protein
MANPLNALTKRVVSLERIVQELSNAPRKQDEAPPHYEHDATKEDHRAKRKAPFSANVTPGPEQANGAKNKWYKTAFWWIVRVIWNFKFLEGVGILAVIVYAVLTYLQWKDLSHNFRIDERAWLEVRRKGDTGGMFALGTLTPGDTIQPQKLVLTNIGKSPAMNIEIRSSSEIAYNEVGPTFGYEVTAFSAAGMSFPNRPWEFPGGAYLNLDESLQRKFFGGRAFLATYGTVTFNDIFGITHWAKFCVWEIAGTVEPQNFKGAKACSDYNSVDSK